MANLHSRDSAHTNHPALCISSLRPSMGGYACTPARAYQSRTVQNRTSHNQLTIHSSKPCGAPAPPAHMDCSMLLKHYACLSHHTCPVFDTGHGVLQSFRHQNSPSTARLLHTPPRQPRSLYPTVIMSHSTRGVLLPANPARMHFEAPHSPSIYYIARALQTRNHAHQTSSGHQLSPDLESHSTSRRPNLIRPWLP
jgi:hypothetical protein